MKEYHLDNPGWTAGLITLSFEKASQNWLELWKKYRHERLTTDQLPSISKGWAGKSNSGDREIQQLESSETIVAFENKLIGKWVSRMLIQGAMPVDIVSESWSWQFGALGVVKWMISDQNLSKRTKIGPSWKMSLSYLVDLEDVEVLLFYGPWPTAGETILKQSSLRVVIRISVCTRSNRRKRWKKSI